MGPTAYANAQEVLGSIWGRVALFLWTFAFFFHMCNGIRHLFWDAGMGFDLKMVYLSGRITVGAAAGLTLLTWIVAYLV